MSAKKSKDPWTDKTNVTFKTFKLDRHDKAYRAGFRYRVGIVRNDGQRVANTQIGIYTRIKTAEGVAELLNQSLQQSGHSVEWEFLPQPDSEEIDQDPCDEPDDDDFEDFSEELYSALDVNDEWTTDESGTIWKINDLESALLQQTSFLHDDDEP